jgi:hypothetical protein
MSWIFVVDGICQISVLKSIFRSSLIFASAHGDDIPYPGQGRNGFLQKDIAGEI